MIKMQLKRISPLFIRRVVYIFTIVLYSAGNSYGQFWFEDFGFDFINCSSQGQLANGSVTVNGQWTVTDIGTQGALSNRWFISATEGGVDPDFTPCGIRCIDDPAVFDQTLHIGWFNNPVADMGARYVGFVGPPGQNIYTTNKRAESPVIDCTGQWGISIEFEYATIPNADDNATLEYFDGTAWIPLVSLPNTGSCGTQVNWENFTFNLPSAAFDNPNVRIGIRWQNNSDGLSTAVSIAVDDIALFAGPDPAVPVAGFNAIDNITTFCEGQCTQFESTTTFDPDYSTGVTEYQWTFEGGTPATSDEASPTVCYETPGNYDVTLVVVDNIGPSAPVTLTNYIVAQDCGPSINMSVSQSVICANEECVDFSSAGTTTPNQVLSWLWTFTSETGVETTSNLENPTNICLNEPGFYDVTLEATDEDATETMTINNIVEVLDCSGPDIEFSSDRTVICPGDCIQLTDESTSNGTITAWNWDLPGGQAQGEDEPGVSNQQNPLVCYDVAGVYNITLSAVDQEGPSAITKTITITVDPCTGPPQVGIGASADTICTGDCVNFVDQSLGLVEDYLWVFQGTADINDATSTEEDPMVICYSQPGSYDVTLTVSNSNGEIDSQTFSDYIVVEQCVNPPVPRIEVSADTICAGKCVDFQSVSTGIGISEYIWNFQGAVPGSGTSTEENPTGICYNQVGSYAVSLQVIGVGGDSIRVFNNTVTVINSAECRPVIEINAPDTLCAGDCANFEGIFTDADSVRWTFNGGTPAISTATNPGIVCFDEEGDTFILVEAWNESGAASPTVLDLYIGERPPLNAGPDRTINSGAVIKLTANLGEEEPVGTFLWQPFDLVDDFTAQTVTTSPDETTKFIVYYKDPGNCTANDTVTVFVNFVEAIGVPTAFSPNGDGVNDQLRVLGQGISRIEFKVFNRYGQLVFETRNQSEGWDGTHNGKDLNPGVFVYTLEVTFAEEGNFEVYTGNVTLVK